MTAEPERAPLSTEVSDPESEASPHARDTLLHFRLFKQRKQRNVFRVAVLYLVVCWLILEPVHVVFHMLEVPAWANRLVVMLMAVGFPASVHPQAHRAAAGSRHQCRARRGARLLCRRQVLDLATLPRVSTGDVRDFGCRLHGSGPSKSRSSFTVSESSRQAARRA